MIGSDERGYPIVAPSKDECGVKGQSMCEEGGAKAQVH